jgi:hypothetical protein
LASRFHGGKNWAGNAGQYPAIGLNVPFPIQAHHAQNGGCGAFADGKYGDEQQDLDGLENPLGKTGERMRRFAEESS